MSYRGLLVYQLEGWDLDWTKMGMDLESKKIMVIANLKRRVALSRDG